MIGHDSSFSQHAQGSTQSPSMYKYVTGSNITALQLCDPAFRQQVRQNACISELHDQHLRAYVLQVLIQILILFDYLTCDVAKQKKYVCSCCVPYLNNCSRSIVLPEQRQADRSTNRQGAGHHFQSLFGMQSYLLACFIDQSQSIIHALSVAHSSITQRRILH